MRARMTKSAALALVTLFLAPSVIEGALRPKVCPAVFGKEVVSSMEDKTGIYCTYARPYG